MSTFLEIPEFPRYKISNEGKVLSSKYKGTRVSRLLNPVIGSDGYFKISLYDQKGNRKTKRINRLILEAFVGECPEAYQAAHINGNKLDNRVTNLAWVSPMENHEHRKKHGTNQAGEKNPRAKLTLKEIIKIRKNKESTISALSRKYGVTRTTIRNIKIRKIWKDF